jgi:hypothetical protein
MRLKDGGPSATVATVPVIPPGYEEHARKAVAHYWQTLGMQTSKQSAGDADRGNRQAVTGGKQMNGFCELVRWAVAANGMPDASIYVRDKLELPGFFRATKKWDLVVVHKMHLVAAVEFKSQAGPSFGNNFNNRTEEALGNATDISTAFREGAFGIHGMRPWVGWMILVERCDASMRPVGVDEPHFKAFQEFYDASYAKRYELLLRKLLLERHYDGAALVLSDRNGGLRGEYDEPGVDLTIKRFLAGLGGHVQAFLASM